MISTANGRWRAAFFAAYEGGDWEAVAAGALALGVPEAAVSTAYRRALAWAAEARSLMGTPTG